MSKGNRGGNEEGTEGIEMTDLGKLLRSWTNSDNQACSDAADYIDNLEAQLKELEALLKAAQCPCCDGSGAYYSNMGEVCQCQWCDEVSELLPEDNDK